MRVAKSDVTKFSSDIYTKKFTSLYLFISIFVDNLILKANLMNTEDLNLKIKLEKLIKPQPELNLASFLDKIGAENNFSKKFPS